MVIENQRNKRNSRLKSILNIRTLIIMLFIPLFLISVSELSYSKPKKKKRSRRVSKVYNPKKTKANALAVLHTSDELTELAGLEAENSNSNDLDSNKNALNLNENNSNPAKELTNNNLDNSADTSFSDIEMLKAYLNEDVEEIGELGEDIAELEAEDDVQVNLEDFKSLWLMAIGADENEEDAKTSYGVEKEALMETIVDWLGTPYKFGGTSRKAVDCSAWIKNVFYQVDSIILPRTAREQVLIGRKVSRDKLEFGDLVFFHTYSRKFASHVGIYLGDDLFAHASSAVGVTISSLNSTFYAKRFIGGRRFSETDYENYKVAVKSGDDNLK
jgi:cell wall-associated NlpC family hydrolase